MYFFFFNLNLASSPNPMGSCFSFNNITVFGFVFTETLIVDHPVWTNISSRLGNAYANANDKCMWMSCYVNNTF